MTRILNDMQMSQEPRGGTRTKRDEDFVQLAHKKRLINVTRLERNHTGGNLERRRRIE